MSESMSAGRTTVCHITVMRSRCEHSLVRYITQSSMESPGSHAALSRPRTLPPARPAPSFVVSCRFSHSCVPRLRDGDGSAAAFAAFASASPPSPPPRLRLPPPLAAPRPPAPTGSLELGGRCAERLARRRPSALGPRRHLRFLAAGASPARAPPPAPPAPAPRARRPPSARLSARRPAPPPRAPPPRLRRRRLRRRRGRRRCGRRGIRLRHVFSPQPPQWRGDRRRRHHLDAGAAVGFAAAATFGAATAGAVATFGADPAAATAGAAAAAAVSAAFAATTFSAASRNSFMFFMFSSCAASTSDSQH